MYDQPTASELLEAVSRFLVEEVMPALDGRLAFHTRVAANVVDLVRREVELGPAARAAAAARLAALLGRDGPLAEQEQALCAAVTDGTLSSDDPALTDHLWATALDTLAVDQPGYATWRAARAQADTL